jgi:riboflavin kinase / FMN adenylyltransferase
LYDNAQSLKIYNSISSFQPGNGTVVTLGTFDGVHVGHAEIIRLLRESAQREGCESLLLTFFPHPRMVLQDYSGIRLLNTMAEKASLLEKAGLDNLVVHPFDRDFSRLTAEEFVKTVLVDRFRARKVIIGHDHRFGRNRTADIHDLKAFGETYGFEVEELPSQQVGAVPVSSTKIRNALAEGNISLANQYLGYDYFLTGTVVSGRQIGRTIGFPTANIEVDEPYKLIPKQGIYVVCSQLGDRTVFGMMSIGTNPTVNGDRQTLEVYYFDFSEDLYGAVISVSFLSYIRDEAKFGSLDELTAALRGDQAFSMNFIKNREA